MIVKAGSDSLTNLTPTGCSTSNATICCTSGKALSERTDAIFRKSPSELLRYLLVLDGGGFDGDVIETNVKKRKNNRDESPKVAGTVIHAECGSVSNKSNISSFCSNFYDDKHTVEMGVFSLSCDSVKCGSASVCQPSPDVKDGRMDERCERSEDDVQNPSRLYSEAVQSFREILERTISSEESTRTEQYSDDDLPLLPGVFPEETLEFILSGTEKHLHIESPTDATSDSSELTELRPRSELSQFSPVATTSKEVSDAINVDKIVIKDSDKNDDGDEMVLVPSGKLKLCLRG